MVEMFKLKDIYAMPQQCALSRVTMEMSATSAEGHGGERLRKLYSRRPKARHDPDVHRRQDVVLVVNRNPT